MSVMTEPPANGHRYEDDRHPMLEESDRPDPHEYPRLFNRSARFFWEGVPRALDPLPAEYVTVNSARFRGVETDLAVANWNMLWEAAQFRRYMPFEPDLPEPLRDLVDQEDTNVLLVPRSRSRYYEYAPLLHLLPAAELRRSRLPVLASRHWPYTVGAADADRVVPRDFGVRLGRAWASRVWRDLPSGSPEGAFNRDDPVRLLAHNLDFWLPPVTEVLHDLLRELPEGAVPNEDDVLEDRVELDDGTILDGVVIAEPRGGRDLWRGEVEAASVVRRVVERADAGGRLRGMLDAVRAHRVEEDFSERWSPARADFERKLYRRRDKIKVRFVELDDTVTVQGPETEVVGDQVCADFLALLDPVDRAVVVLLTRGTTRIGAVAEALGYANHSPISKRLARIRAQAQHYFDNT
jgi:hypothetical protein